MANQTPRWYAHKIVDWVMRQIDKCPAEWRDLIRVTVATELYKREPKR